VFAADRAALNGMLDALQAANLDPTAIEPDILCLARFLEQNFSALKDTNPLFVVLADQSCHIIKPQGHHLGPMVRSFIIGASQNKATVLAREIPLTLAAMNLHEPVDSLLIAGQTDQLDVKALSESTGIAAETIDLTALTGADQSLLADCASQVEFVMACGAAIAEIKRIKTSDFRRSFAPYQGKRMVLQRTLRTTSIFVSISMIVLALYFQLKVMRINGYVGDLDRKMAGEYVKAMYGREPRSDMSILRQLDRAHKKVERIKKGGAFGDEGSVPAKLTYMLEAINKSPKKIVLNVSTVDVTTKTMSLTGNTRRRADTLALLNSFKSHPKLVKGYVSYDEKANRDAFTIHLNLKK